jgi:hypothetical protein
MDPENFYGRKFEEAAITRLRAGHASAFAGAAAGGIYSRHQVVTSANSEKRSQKNEKQSIANDTFMFIYPVIYM